MDARGGAAARERISGAAGDQRLNNHTPADSSKTNGSGSRSGGRDGGGGGGGSSDGGDRDLLQTVAVSLSGGVDSMALCLALVHLKPVYGFEVMGIHIDYGNRHESGREADFVEEWCARHGVIFYKKTIAEVRCRGVYIERWSEKIRLDNLFLISDKT